MIDLTELSVDGLRQLLTAHAVEWTDSMVPSELMEAARKAGIPCRDAESFPDAQDPNWGRCAEVIEFDDDDNVVSTTTVPLKRSLSIVDDDDDNELTSKKPRTEEATTAIKIVYATWATGTPQADCWHVPNSIISHSERLVLQLVDHTCLRDIPHGNTDAQKTVLHCLGVSHGEGGVTDSEWSKWDKYACDDDECDRDDVLVGSAVEMIADSVKIAEARAEGRLAAREALAVPRERAASFLTRLLRLLGFGG